MSIVCELGEYARADDQPLENGLTGWIRRLPPELTAVSGAWRPGTADIAAAVERWKRYGKAKVQHGFDTQVQGDCSGPDQA